MNCCNTQNCAKKKKIKKKNSTEKKKFGKLIMGQSLIRVDLFNLITHWAVLKQNKRHPLMKQKNLNINKKS